jgi:hypothetical protein
MKRLSIAIVALSMLTLTGCRLDPETVRELIENPNGKVGKASMGRVASALVLSDVATTAEDVAWTFKNLLEADIDKIDAGDVFCAGSFTADTVEFAGCIEEDECESELVIDSCLLRIGDADENAAGKIRFKLKNETTSNAQQANLEIHFEDFEASREDGDTTDLFKGMVAVETNVFEDDDELETEVVLSADVESIVRRTERGWFFDDGIEDWQHAIAGVRVTTRADDDDAEGTVEIVAFVDEDGGRDEAVVVRVSGSSTQIDSDTLASTVDIEVEGDNGIFACNFDQLERDADRDGVTVSAKGSCRDEDGDEFDFSGEVLER